MKSSINREAGRSSSGSYARNQNISGHLKEEIAVNNTSKPEMESPTRNSNLKVEPETSNWSSNANYILRQIKVENCDDDPIGTKQFDGVLECYIKPEPVCSSRTPTDNKIIERHEKESVVKYIKVEVAPPSTVNGLIKVKDEPGSSTLCSNTYNMLQQIKDENCDDDPNTVKLSDGIIECHNIKPEPGCSTWRPWNSDDNKIFEGVKEEPALNKVIKTELESNLESDYEGNDALDIDLTHSQVKKESECVLNFEDVNAESESHNKIDVQNAETREQLEEKLFSCSSCNMRFTWKSRLTRHMLIHSREKPFYCSLCGKCFTWKSDLNVHLLTHSGEKPFSCSICNKSFYKKSSLKDHMLIHSGGKPFSCPSCSKCFSHNSYLKKHMMIHSGESPFLCSICSKSFTQKASLTQHMFGHSGEKPFSCSVCNKGFIKKSHMKVHMSIHSGEKPFSCTVCPERFSSKSCLSRHALIHTGIKPFLCVMCNKGFTQKSNLTTHMLSHMRKIKGSKK